MLLRILFLIIKRFSIRTLEGETGSSVCVDPGQFFLGRSLKNETRIGIYEFSERSNILVMNTILTRTSVDVKIYTFTEPPS
jgi:hypothetical protein